MFATQIEIKMKKLSIAFLFLIAVKLAFASIGVSGISDDKLKSNKYSLKNFSSLRHTFSLNSLKSKLHYTSSDVYATSNNNSNIQMNSMMKYDRWNTTFIMPFNYKVKVPKFKTPSPNN